MMRSLLPQRPLEGGRHQELSPYISRAPATPTPAQPWRGDPLYDPAVLGMQPGTGPLAQQPQAQPVDWGQVASDTLGESEPEFIGGAEGLDIMGHASHGMDQYQDMSGFADMNKVQAGLGAMGVPSNPYAMYDQPPAAPMQMGGALGEYMRGLLF